MGNAASASGRISLVVIDKDLLRSSFHVRLAERRQRRMKGERIPEPLWNLVLAAARRRGVNRTATIVHRADRLLRIEETSGSPRFQRFLHSSTNCFVRMIAHTLQGFSNKLFRVPKFIQ